jgi:hypothetical protein
MRNITFNQYYQQRFLLSESQAEMPPTMPSGETPPQQPPAAVEAYDRASKEIENFLDVLTNEMPNGHDLIGKVQQAQQILVDVGKQLVASEPQPSL